MPKEPAKKTDINATAAAAAAETAAAQNEKAEAAIGATWDELYQRSATDSAKRLREAGFAPFFRWSGVKKGDVLVFYVDADAKPERVEGNPEFRQPGQPVSYEYRVVAKDANGEEWTLSMRENSKILSAFAKALAGKRGIRKLQIVRLGEGKDTEWAVTDAGAA